MKYGLFHTQQPADAVIIRDMVIQLPYSENDQPAAQFAYLFSIMSDLVGNYTYDEDIMLSMAEINVYQPKVTYVPGFLVGYGSIYGILGEAKLLNPKINGIFAGRPSEKILFDKGDVEGDLAKTRENALKNLQIFWKNARNEIYEDGREDTLNAGIYHASVAETSRGYVASGRLFILKM